MIKPDDSGRTQTACSSICCGVYAQGEARACRPRRVRMQLLKGTSGMAAMKLNRQGVAGRGRPLMAVRSRPIHRRERQVFGAWPTFRSVASVYRNGLKLNTPQASSMGQA